MWTEVPSTSKQHERFLNLRTDAGVGANRITVSGWVMNICVHSEKSMNESWLFRKNVQIKIFFTEKIWITQ